MKHPIRSTLVAGGVVAVVVALVAAAGWWATSVERLAASGKAQVLSGAADLASMDATGAATGFAAAEDSFASARRLLGPDWLARPLRGLPLAGRQYGAAEALVAIGTDGSVAGAEMAQALRAVSSNDGTAGPGGALGSIIGSGRPHLDAALVALVDATDRADALDERGLVPQLARQVGAVKAALKDAGPLVQRGRAALTLERYLLSSTQRFLVVSQDGAELRPTGGFAGSYGIVEVGPAGFHLQEYRDVYTLPDPPHRVAPPEGATLIGFFSFRDANWWIDYPTSARAMLGFWHDTGQPAVDGMLVIDTVAMKYLLEATGPIEVPRYSETFTPDNLLTRLLYHTQVIGAGRKDRKSVIAALATELETRVLEADPAQLGRTAQALAKAADSKHVQAYFVDPAAEAAVVAFGWSGRIAPPSGTTDLLVISNAMNTGSKINMAMTKTIDYQVALAPDGSAGTTLTLGYANKGPYALAGRNEFSDWLRVSRMPGTGFAAAPTGRATTELGFPTAVRQFSVERGRSHTETVAARVPAAWAADGASPYRLYVVRQADLEDVPTSVTVAAPPGWRVSAVSARLSASGATLPATIADGRASLVAPLSGDLVLDVWLARS